MNTKHAGDNEQDLSGFLILSDRDFSPIGISERGCGLRALSDNPDDLGVSDQDHSNWDDKLNTHQQERICQVERGRRLPINLPHFHADFFHD